MATLSASISVQRIVARSAIGVAHRGAKPSRRSVLGLGICSAAVGAWGAQVLWSESQAKKLQLMLEQSRKDCEERERLRQEQVGRLHAQASWLRLAQLAFIMLPAALLWPLWLIHPPTFWSFVAERIDACGPCFVKLAQWLATRRDLLPESLCSSFGCLHRDVAGRWSKALSSQEVESQLHDADIHVSLENQPCASGSIAEVFFGVLKDGTEVAVKCMRPGVQTVLEADLAWLLRFGRWTEEFDCMRMLGIRRGTEEFCEHVQMQTDFQVEASHLERFRANFEKSHESVHFPAPLFVTRDALVLSRESGQELSQILTPPASCHATDAEGVAGPTVLSDIPVADRQRIARDSMSSYMRMIFKDSFIHGDLHPGNIMLRSRGTRCEGETSSEASASPAENSSSSSSTPSFELVIVDAGLAIPLPQEKVEALRSMAIAMIYADFGRAADIIYRQSPDSSRCLDPAAFKEGLAEAFRSCRRNIWEDGFVQVSDACLESLQLVQRYEVGLDTTLAWTLMGMLSVEGAARQLDPQVDCAKAASQYVLTGSALLRELKEMSWRTSFQMVLEMGCQACGVDYWELKKSAGFHPQSE